MKEITVESLVRVTKIMKVDDTAADQFLQSMKGEEGKRSYGNIVKHQMEADDVRVKELKMFVRDIPEKPAKKATKSSKKKGE